MDFMFGLITGIFGIVVALALFVVHVLKINLDLPAPKANGLHHYSNGTIGPPNHGGGGGPASRESTPGPDFTDISESRLRNMIQKIIAETVDMPPLSKTYAVSEIALDRPSKMADMANGHRHRTEHYFEPTIYQDLLATAVLNKIVDKQSNNNRTMAESTPDLSRAVAAGEDIGAADDIRVIDLDQNYNIENQSITSGSSVEPRSDCSYTDTEPNITTNDDKSSELLMNAGRDSAMSDYLAGHMVPLPDLSKIATESEEDDYMSVTSSVVGDSTWENNWLFKKKKPSLVAGSATTSSVGMLVPDPKEDVRAQIGDKTADEISDLSELGSDTDDSSMDLLRSNLDPINNRMFSKHLIGGQNSKFVLDELIERSSMISNTLPMDQEETYTETRNEHVDAPSKPEAINANVSQQNNNNHEEHKDLEVIIPPTGFGDNNNTNPSTAGVDEFSESDGCTGYSNVEFLEPPLRTPSVVEILAAIALGPMLAVPAADEPAALSTAELITLNELKDLALTEIKSRSMEMFPHSLGVIPEEVGEIDLKNFPTPDEIQEELHRSAEGNNNTIETTKSENEADISGSKQSIAETNAETVESNVSTTCEATDSAEETCQKLHEETIVDVKEGGTIEAPEGTSAATPCAVPPSLTEVDVVNEDKTSSTGNCTQEKTAECVKCEIATGESAPESQQETCQVKTTDSVVETQLEEVPAEKSTSKSKEETCEVVETKVEEVPAERSVPEPKEETAEGKVTNSVIETKVEDVPKGKPASESKQVTCDMVEAKVEEVLTGEAGPEVKATFSTETEMPAEGAAPESKQEPGDVKANDAVVEAKVEETATETEIPTEVAALKSKEETAEVKATDAKVGEDPSGKSITEPKQETCEDEATDCVVETKVEEVPIEKSVPESKQESSEVKATLSTETEMPAEGEAPESKQESSDVKANDSVLETKVEEIPTETEIPTEVEAPDSKQEPQATDSKEEEDPTEKSNTESKEETCENKATDPVVETKVEEASIEKSVPETKEETSEAKATDSVVETKVEDVPTGEPVSESKQDTCETKVEEVPTGEAGSESKKGTSEVKTTFTTETKIPAEAAASESKQEPGNVKATDSVVENIVKEISAETEIPTEVAASESKQEPEEVKATDSIVENVPGEKATTESKQETCEDKATDSVLDTKVEEVTAEKSAPEPKEETSEGKATDSLVETKVEDVPTGEPASESKQDTRDVVEAKVDEVPTGEAGPESKQETSEIKATYSTETEIPAVASASESKQEPVDVNATEEIPTETEIHSEVAAPESKQEPAEVKATDSKVEEDPAEKAATESKQETCEDKATDPVVETKVEVASIEKSVPETKEETSEEDDVPTGEPASESKQDTCDVVEAKVEEVPTGEAVPESKQETSEVKATFSTKTEIPAEAAAPESRQELGDVKATEEFPTETEIHTQVGAPESKQEPAEVKATDSKVEDVPAEKSVPEPKEETSGGKATDPVVETKVENVPTVEPAPESKPEKVDEVLTGEPGPESKPETFEITASDPVVVEKVEEIPTTIEMPAEVAASVSKQETCEVKTTDPVVETKVEEVPTGDAAPETKQETCAAKVEDVPTEAPALKGESCELTVSIETEMPAEGSTAQPKQECCGINANDPKVEEVLADKSATESNQEKSEIKAADPVIETKVEEVPTGEAAPESKQETCDAKVDEIPTEELAPESKDESCELTESKQESCEVKASDPKIEEVPAEKTDTEPKEDTCEVKADDFAVERKEEEVIVTDPVVERKEEEVIVTDPVVETKVEEVPAEKFAPASKEETSELKATDLVVEKNVDEIPTEAAVPEEEAPESKQESSEVTATDPVVETKVEEVPAEKSAPTPKEESSEVKATDSVVDAKVEEVPTAEPNTESKQETCEVKTTGNVVETKVEDVLAEKSKEESSEFKATDPVVKTKVEEIPTITGLSTEGAAPESKQEPCEAKATDSVVETKLEEIPTEAEIPGERAPADSKPEATDSVLNTKAVEAPKDSEASESKPESCEVKATGFDVNTKVEDSPASEEIIVTSSEPSSVVHSPTEIHEETMSPIGESSEITKIDETNVEPEASKESNHELEKTSSGDGSELPPTACVNKETSITEAIIPNNKVVTATTESEAPATEIIQDAAVIEPSELLVVPENSIEVSSGQSSEALMSLADISALEIGIHNGLSAADVIVELEETEIFVPPPPEFSPVDDLTPQHPEAAEQNTIDENLGTQALSIPETNDTEDAAPSIEETKTILKNANETNEESAEVKAAATEIFTLKDELELIAEPRVSVEAKVISAQPAVTKEHDSLQEANKVSSTTIKLETPVESAEAKTISDPIKSEETSSEVAATIAEPIVSVEATITSEQPATIEQDSQPEASTVSSITKPNELETPVESVEAKVTNDPIESEQRSSEVAESIAEPIISVEATVTSEQPATIEQDSQPEANTVSSITESNELKTPVESVEAKITNDTIESEGTSPVAVNIQEAGDSKDLETIHESAEETVTSQEPSVAIEQPSSLAVITAVCIAESNKSETPSNVSIESLAYSEVSLEETTINIQVVVNKDSKGSGIQLKSSEEPKSMEVTSQSVEETTTSQEPGPPAETIEVQTAVESEAPAESGEAKITKYPTEHDTKSVETSEDQANITEQPTYQSGASYTTQLTLEATESIEEHTVKDKSKTEIIPTYISAAKSNIEHTETLSPNIPVIESDATFIPPPTIMSSSETHTTLSEQSQNEKLVTISIEDDLMMTKMLESVYEPAGESKPEPTTESTSSVVANAPIQTQNESLVTILIEDGGELQSVVEPIADCKPEPTTESTSSTAIANVPVESGATSEVPAEITVVQHLPTTTEVPSEPKNAVIDPNDQVATKVVTDPVSPISDIVEISIDSIAPTAEVAEANESLSPNTSPEMVNPTEVPENISEEPLPTATVETKIDEIFPPPPAFCSDSLDETSVVTEPTQPEVSEASKTGQELKETAASKTVAAESAPDETKSVASAEVTEDPIVTESSSTATSESMTCSPNPEPFVTAATDSVTTLPEDTVAENIIIASTVDVILIESAAIPAHVAVSVPEELPLTDPQRTQVHITLKAGSLDSDPEVFSTPPSEVVVEYATCLTSPEYENAELNENALQESKELTEKPVEEVPVTNTARESDTPSSLVIITESEHDTISSELVIEQAALSTPPEPEMAAQKSQISEELPVPTSVPGTTTMPAPVSATDGSEDHSNHIAEDPAKEKVLPPKQQSVCSTIDISLAKIPVVPEATASTTDDFAASHSTEVSVEITIMPAATKANDDTDILVETSEKPIPVSEELPSTLENLEDHPIPAAEDAIVESPKLPSKESTDSTTDVPTITSVNVASESTAPPISEVVTDSLISEESTARSAENSEPKSISPTIEVSEETNISTEADSAAEPKPIMVVSLSVPQDLTVENLEIPTGNEDSARTANESTDLTKQTTSIDDALVEIPVLSENESTVKVPEKLISTCDVTEINVAATSVAETVLVLEVSATVHQESTLQNPEEHGIPNCEASKNPDNESTESTQETTYAECSVPSEVGNVTVETTPPVPKAEVQISTLFVSSEEPISISATTEINNNVISAVSVTEQVSIMNESPREHIEPTVENLEKTPTIANEVPSTEPGTEPAIPTTEAASPEGSETEAVAETHPTKVDEFPREHIEPTVENLEKPPTLANEVPSTEPGTESTNPSTETTCPENLETEAATETPPPEVDESATARSSKESTVEEQINKLATTEINDNTTSVISVNESAPIAEVLPTSDSVLQEFVDNEPKPATETTSAEDSTIDAATEIPGTAESTAEVLRETTKILAVTEIDGNFAAPVEEGKNEVLPLGLPTAEETVTQESPAEIIEEPTAPLTGKTGTEVFVKPEHVSACLCGETSSAEVHKTAEITTMAIETPSQISEQPVEKTAAAVEDASEEHATESLPPNLLEVSEETTNTSVAGENYVNVDASADTTTESIPTEILTTSTITSTVVPVTPDTESDVTTAATSAECAETSSAEVHATALETPLQISEEPVEETEAVVEVTLPTIENVAVSASEEHATESLPPTTIENTGTTEMPTEISAVTATTELTEVQISSDPIVEAISSLEESVPIVKPTNELIPATTELASLEETVPQETTTENLEEPATTLKEKSNAEFSAQPEPSCPCTETSSAEVQATADIPTTGTEITTSQSSAQPIEETVPPSAIEENVVNVSVEHPAESHQEEVPEITTTTSVESKNNYIVTETTSAECSVIDTTTVPSIVDDSVPNVVANPATESASGVPEEDTSISPVIEIECNTSSANSVAQPEPVFEVPSPADVVPQESTIENLEKSVDPIHEHSAIPDTKSISTTTEEILPQEVSVENIEENVAPLTENTKEEVATKPDPAPTSSPSAEVHVTSEIPRATEEIVPQEASVENLEEPAAPLTENTTTEDSAKPEPTSTSPSSVEVHVTAEIPTTTTAIPTSEVNIVQVSPPTIEDAAAVMSVEHATVSLPSTTESLLVEVSEETRTIAVATENNDKADVSVDATTETIPVTEEILATTTVESSGEISSIEVSAVLEVSTTTPSITDLIPPPSDFCPAVELESPTASNEQAIADDHSSAIESTTQTKELSAESISTEQVPSKSLTDIVEVGGTESSTSAISADSGVSQSKPSDISKTSSIQTADKEAIQCAAKESILPLQVTDITANTGLDTSQAEVMKEPATKDENTAEPSVELIPPVREDSETPVTDVNTSAVDESGAATTSEPQALPDTLEPASSEIPTADEKVCPTEPTVPDQITEFGAPTEEHAVNNPNSVETSTNKPELEQSPADKLTEVQTGETIENESIVAEPPTSTTLESQPAPDTKATPKETTEVHVTESSAETPDPSKKASDVETSAVTDSSNTTISEVSFPATSICQTETCGTNFSTTSQNIPNSEETTCLTESSSSDTHTSAVIVSATEPKEDVVIPVSGIVPDSAICLSSVTTSITSDPSVMVSSIEASACPVAEPALEVSASEVSICTEKLWTAEICVDNALCSKLATEVPIPEESISSQCTLSSHVESTDTHTSTVSEPALDKGYTRSDSECITTDISSDPAIPLSDVSPTVTESSSVTTPQDSGTPTEITSNTAAESVDVSVSLTQAPPISATESTSATTTDSGTSAEVVGPDLATTSVTEGTSENDVMKTSGEYAAESIAISNESIAPAPSKVVPNTATESIAVPVHLTEVPPFSATVTVSTSATKPDDSTEPVSTASESITAAPCAVASDIGADSVAVAEPLAEVTPVLATAEPTSAIMPNSSASTEVPVNIAAKSDSVPTPSPEVLSESLVIPTSDENSTMAEPKCLEGCATEPIATTTNSIAPAPCAGVSNIGPDSVAVPEPEPLTEVPTASTTATESTSATTPNETGESTEVTANTAALSDSVPIPPTEVSSESVVIPNSDENLAMPESTCRKEPTELVATTTESIVTATDLTVSDSSASTDVPVNTAAGSDSALTPLTKVPSNSALDEKTTLTSNESVVATPCAAAKNIEQLVSLTETVVEVSTCSIAPDTVVLSDLSELPALHEKVTDETRAEIQAEVIEKQMNIELSIDAGISSSFVGTTTESVELNESLTQSTSDIIASEGHTTNNTAGSEIIAPVTAEPSGNLQENPPIEDLTTSSTTLATPSSESASIPVEIAKIVAPVTAASSGNLQETSPVKDLTTSIPPTEPVPLPVDISEIVTPVPAESSGDLQETPSIKDLTTSTTTLATPPTESEHISVEIAEIVAPESVPIPAEIVVPVTAKSSGNLQEAPPIEVLTTSPTTLATPCTESVPIPVEIVAAVTTESLGDLQETPADEDLTTYTPSTESVAIPVEIVPPVTAESSCNLHETPPVGNLTTSTITLATPCTESAHIPVEVTEKCAPVTAESSGNLQETLPVEDLNTSTITIATPCTESEPILVETTELVAQVPAESSGNVQESPPVEGLTTFTPSTESVPITLEIVAPVTAKSSGNLQETPPVEDITLSLTTLATPSTESVPIPVQIAEKVAPVTTESSGNLQETPPVEDLTTSTITLATPPTESVPIPVEVTEIVTPVPAESSGNLQETPPVEDLTTFTLSTESVPIPVEIIAPVTAESSSNLQETPPIEDLTTSTTTLATPSTESVPNPTERAEIVAPITVESSGNLQKTPPIEDLTTSSTTPSTESVPIPVEVTEIVTPVPEESSGNLQEIPPIEDSTTSPTSIEIPCTESVPTPVEITEIVASVTAESSDNLQDTPQIENLTTSTITPAVPSTESVEIVSPVTAESSGNLQETPPVEGLTSSTPSTESVPIPVEIPPHQLIEEKPSADDVTLNESVPPEIELKEPTPPPANISDSSTTPVALVTDPTTSTYVSRALSADFPSSEPNNTSEQNTAQQLTIAISEEETHTNIPETSHPPNAEVSTDLFSEPSQDRDDDIIFVEELNSPILTQQSTVVEAETEPGSLDIDEEPAIASGVGDKPTIVQPLDQLSTKSTSQTGDSSQMTSSTEEEFILNEDSDDEMDILVDKFSKRKTRKIKTNTTTTSNTTTNTRTKLSDKITIKHDTSATSSKSNTNSNTNPGANHELLTLTRAVERTQGSSAAAAMCSNNVGQHVANGTAVQQDITVAVMEDENDDDDDDDLMTSLPHFVPGSIAEREYKKWYNSVEMPNNPYAPEALKKRISGSQERFIDLPNISPSTEQSPLEMIAKEKMENDEVDKRESDYRRYSRDYYINDSSRSSQISSPVRDHPQDAIEIKQKPEQEPVPETFQTLSPTTQTEEEIVIDLYKAIPAQVVEDSTASSLETLSQKSIQSGTTTSDDSDTIKIYDFKKQETTTITREAKENEEVKPEQAPAVIKERPTVLNLNRQESNTAAAVGTTPVRGSTPSAFKFLQPKRKLLDPSQVLSLDEDEPPAAGSSVDKPVIEKEVVQALPSVKALAKAFLMTSSSIQHSSTERMWARKAKKVIAAGKSPIVPVNPLENPTPTDVDKSEEDITITSDLSSLETDPSSTGKKSENTKDQTSSPPAENTPTTTTTPTTTGTSPTTPRQGVLKSNIAFFENLKYK